MSKVRGGRVRFDPNRILMSGGATGANELIMFCLADPGDAFLVPTPYYPGYACTFLFHNLLCPYSLYMHAYITISLTFFFVLNRLKWCVYIWISLPLYIVITLL